MRPCFSYTPIHGNVPQFSESIAIYTLHHTCYILSHIPVLFVIITLSSSLSIPFLHFIFPHDSPSFSPPPPFLFAFLYLLLTSSLFSACLPVSLLIPFSLLSFSPPLIELKYTLVLDEQEARVGLMEQDGQFGSNVVVRNITIPEPDRQYCQNFTFALRVSDQCRADCARGYWYDLGHAKVTNGFELTRVS